MKTLSAWIVAATCFITLASAAHARSAHDGSWDLMFVTETGTCDPTYNFAVNVSDGVVTHPNLVKFIRQVRVGSCVGDGSRKNSLPAQAGFSGRPVAKNGAAAREVRDVRATGPRNAF